VLERQELLQPALLINRVLNSNAPVEEKRTVFAPTLATRKKSVICSFPVRYSFLASVVFACACSNCALLLTVRLWIDITEVSMEVPFARNSSRVPLIPPLSLLSTDLIRSVLPLWSLSSMIIGGSPVTNGSDVRLSHYLPLERNKRKNYLQNRR